MSGRSIHDVALRADLIEQAFKDRGHESHALILRQWPSRAGDGLYLLCGEMDHATWILT